MSTWVWFAIATDVQPDILILDEVLSVGDESFKNKCKQLFVYEKYESSVGEVEITLARWMRVITLNGHLLPDFIFYKNDKVADKVYKIVPILRSCTSPWRIEFAAIQTKSACADSREIKGLKPAFGFAVAEG